MSLWMWRKMGCRQCEISQRSNFAVGDFGALAGLCPGASIFLYARPHKTLYDEFCRCFGAWVQHRGWTGTLGGVKRLERTVESFRQTCRSRWRWWCQEFVASRAVGRCLMPEVFEVCGWCPAMQPAPCRMVAHWWIWESRNVAYVSGKPGD
jgi:hypothetical protein